MSKLRALFIVCASGLAIGLLYLGVLIVIGCSIAIVIAIPAYIVVKALS